VKAKAEWWQTRADDEATQRNDLAWKILDKVDSGQPLVSAEREFLSTLLQKYIFGADLRGELYERVKGRARPSHELRDGFIREQFEKRLAKNPGQDKRIIGELSIQFELGEERIRKIVK
jgi:hypothetical protein